MQVSDFYDAAYFSAQSQGGDIQGEANAFKFTPFLKPGDRVLDFGCGSGALLRALAPHSDSQIGVEINPSARAYASKEGTEVVEDISHIPDASIDIVVSNHAIEHVENPLAMIREFHRVLRPGGRIALVVPCDRTDLAFREDDPDFHLFSWSANNIGNLAKAGGFTVDHAEEILHKWPPRWLAIRKALGASGFDLACRIWARIDRRRRQARVVGHKVAT